MIQLKRSFNGYLFTFGDSLLRMGDGPMFFSTRGKAIEAALKQGLTITAYDLVESIRPRGDYRLLQEPVKVRCDNNGNPVDSDGNLIPD